MALNLYSFTDDNSYTLQSEVFFGSISPDYEYDKLELIGQGALSLVYRAKHKKENNTVAIKYLKQDHDKTSLRKEVFREVNILKSLNHNNIIKLHELILDAELNNLCLVLEFCVCSVEQIITKATSKLHLDQVKCIAKQMFKGLNYLHKNYIIHRDLKPQNLLVSSDGILKIIDFDMSRKYRLQELNMTPGLVTRWYRPPELLLESPAYGTQVDLWSAGCIMMELETRKPLLPGDTDIQQLNLIIDLLGAPNVGLWPGLKDCKRYRNINIRNEKFGKLKEMLDDNNINGRDVINDLLIYDPNQRLTADDCYYHDWFEQAPYPASSIKIPLQL